MTKPSILNRPEWKTTVGFVLAAIGSAIGLGNIWRFPYLCYKNGGGAFLIPYFAALLIVGIPLMIMEIGFGHKMRGSSPASFAGVSKKAEWIGWWQVIFVMFGINLYYCVIISWCVNYLFFSFGQSWGSDPNAFFFDKFLMVSRGPAALGDVRTPIVFALAGVWAINWTIVYCGVQKGLERANKIFMPLLIAMTAIIVLWSIRLSGAMEGIRIYLTPDFSRLSDIGVWMDAFSQIFFTLSLGFGIMIAYASYLPRKTRIVRNSVIICLANCGFSIFAGFGVFSILGYMAHSTDKPFSEVVSQSIGLAFVAYPKAISMLPAFSNLFGVIFFGILVIAGISSSISIIEAFTSAIIDKFHYPRKAVVSALSLAGFLGSIVFATRGGLHWLDIADHFITRYGLVLAAIAGCIVAGWIFKASRLREHINHYSLWRITGAWDAAIKIAIPLVLIVLLGSALVEEINTPYSGYSWVSIILIGRDWLLYTLFIALIVASHPWKTEPKERMITHK